MSRGDLMSEPVYLTTAEVAEHYRTTPSVIRYWRHRGTGPKGVPVGKRVLYPRSEIEKYDRELQKQIKRQLAADKGGEEAS
jgi:DNA-binding transcriptional MerR regulator